MVDSPTPTPAPAAGTPLPTVNATASLVDKDITTVGSALISFLETAAITAWPWLNIVGLKQIWEGLANWLGGQINSFFGALGGYILIDMQKYYALKNVATAWAALSAAKQGGDSEAINQASANMDTAVAPVMHYVGSVSGS